MRIAGDIVLTVILIAETCVWGIVGFTYYLDHREKRRKK